jgi:peptide/nickel transport system substrate-binding protein
MKKNISYILIAVLILTVIAGCTNVSAPASDKVLVVRTYGDPQSFVPDNSGDDMAYAINQNLFNRLVKLDASKQIIPDLAEKWDFSSDGKVITFTLVKNAKWHDGKPVTSADVKYTFDYIKSDPTTFFNGQMENVEAVEAPDDYTVVFKMKEPNVAMIGYLGWYGTFIMPKHIFDNGQTWDENPAAMNPIGSGPFKFGEFKQGEKIVIVANPDYFGGAPKVSQVVFRIIPDDSTAVQALINGEIDVLEGVPSTEVENLKKNQNVRLALNEYPSPMYMVFNFKYEPLQDPALRKAIATAINKQEISDKIFLGIQKPEYNMYPSLINWASNSEQTSPKHNTAAARKILEDAGYQLDSDGFYVRGLTLDIFEGWGYPESGQIIQSNLKDAGIEVKLNVMEFNAWNEKVFINRNFILEIQGGFQGPDPAALGSRLSTNGVMNQGSYSNPKVDALFEEGNRIGDKTQRAKIYKDIQAMLAEDLPIVPIVMYSAFDANRSNVTNVPIDGAGKWGWQEYTFTEVK